MKSLVFLALAAILFPSFAFADTHITLVQHADIAEIMMKKQQINIENTDFTIFYRFSTVGEGESSDEDHQAQIKSIDINKERKSLVISIEDINQDDIMSVRFPQELVSAEGKKLVLLIDGEEKGYESSSQDDKSTMIFVLPEGSTQIEIVGTRVIPEFTSSILIMVVVLSVALLVPVFAKHTKRI